MSCVKHNVCDCGCELLTDDLSTLLAVYLYTCYMDDSIVAVVLLYVCVFIYDSVHVVYCVLLYLSAFHVCAHVS